MNNIKIKVLIQFMEKHELSNMQCAKILHVTEGAIRYWKKGEREIPDSIIELIKYKTKEVNNVN